MASTALCLCYSSIEQKELDLKKIMTSMHPQTNIYTKFEDLFFKSEVLRCNGCEILPSAKKLDGELTIAIRLQENGAAIFASNGWT